MIDPEVKVTVNLENSRCLDVEYTITAAGKICFQVPSSLSFTCGYDHDYQPNIKIVAPISKNGCIQLSQLKNMGLRHPSIV